jgi:hypothetical protein
LIHKRSLYNASYIPDIDALHRFLTPPPNPPENPIIASNCLSSSRFLSSSSCSFFAFPNAPFVLLTPSSSSSCPVLAFNRASSRFRFLPSFFSFRRASSSWTTSFRRDSKSKFLLVILDWDWARRRSIRARTWATVERRTWVVWPSRARSIVGVFYMSGIEEDSASFEQNR